MKSLLAIIVFLSLGANLAQAAKTFVYCSEGSPSVFNPQLATDGTTFNASSRTIYNRLVEFERGGTKVVPGLAEKWTTSKDGKSFSFSLRKGVKFHTTKYFTPKRDFNADDVMFTFNRMMEKKHPFHKVNGGTYEYFTSMEMDKIISKLEKVDPYTVRFTLSRPEASFVANLAMDFASILSAEYGTHLTKEGRKTDIDTKPIGTGPFAFKRYQKDQLIRYVKNPDYYEGPAKIDNLVFSITVDPTVRFQKLKRGECHFATDPSPTDLAAMRKDKNLKLMSQPGLNVGYLAMNTEKKPFDSAKVRRAINHALNREAYIKAIYLGNAQVAKNPIPPTMWSYNKSVKKLAYNPKLAKKLLKEAGYPKGFKTELWALPVSRPYNPNGKKMAEMMQADLKKVGIDAKVVTYKWATYLDKSSKGEHQLLQLGWTGDNGDPDNFLHVLLSCGAVEGGSNRARWCNKKYSTLVDQAKVTTDIRRREKLYRQAQAIFKQEAPWVTLAHSTVFKAMTKNVVGYKMSPFGTEQFYGVDLKK